MQLFFNPDIDKHTQQITFDKIESKHIIRVLRKKEGDTIFITNGKGLLFKCQLTSDDYKKCSVSILSQEEKQRSRDYYLHVAIAPTKNISRLEWFLEKATEIGIDEITPIICQNSERKVIKFERLEKIVVSAMKQSLKFYLPKLNKPIYFDDFLERKQEGKVCIAHCEKGEKKLLKSIVSSREPLTILIGPEGDFSAIEITKSIDSNFIPITLGETRLRTETAALVAVNNISFINQ